MNKHCIHILPSHVANQIAAGEVVERPASVVKELVENSLDAGAKHIAVRITGAGKKRIEIEDDGCGMSAVDAEMALQRHATSKIETADDLYAIASHGFRGEALPSIASVSRFRMQTCTQGSDEAVDVRVDAGGETTLRPAPPREGTKIEILDLFLNTPARLNFMRTDKTEEAAIVDVFKTLALAHPKVAMSLTFDERSRFDFQAQDEHERVLAIMGKDFSKNSIEQAIEHESILVSAHLGVPTFHHRNSTRMIFFINGRVIRDKALIAALRAGYRDVMFHDRYPVALIRLEMDAATVDVNVHPAKREVRFKSPQTVRAAVVACVRAGIEQMGQYVASTTTEQALHAMQGQSQSQPVAHSNMPKFSSSKIRYDAPVSHDDKNIQKLLFRAPYVAEAAHERYAFKAGALDLGRAVAQLHRCYIIAQTDEGIVLVDQHAAHERICYEGLKQQLNKHDVAAQMLLTPLSLHTSGEVSAWLHEHMSALNTFAVDIEAAGEDVFLVRSVPALLSGESLESLVLELIDACMLIGVNAEGNGRVLERWLGNRACKGSIKSGRVLLPEEQENLLREMERTPNIAQCNHGRPTYVRLSLHELDRLFGRKE